MHPDINFSILGRGAFCFRDQMGIFSIFLFKYLISTNKKDFIHPSDLLRTFEVNKTLVRILNFTITNPSVKKKKMCSLVILTYT